MARKFPWPDDLADVVRAAFGTERSIGSVARLRGGSKKGVYRLTFDDASTAVSYIWDPAENYWPVHSDRSDTGRADPFSDASGADLFEASHAQLDGLGIRTPRVYLLDRTRNRYPSDFAVVEDVRGETLETLIRRDPREAERPLAELGGFLQVMRRQHGRAIGKLVLADRRSLAPDRTCEQVVLDRALGHLADAAARIDSIAAARGRLEDATRELAAAVRPRADYGLVHGELGPDHVLLDQRGHPVLIDIEGAMFFDVEWEHAFLRLRFGEHYPPLSVSDLDDRRLRFYTLALHLSLIAGPLRLLEGDYPERQPMMAIVDSNIHRALAFVR